MGIGAGGVVGQNQGTINAIGDLHGQCRQCDLRRRTQFRAAGSWPATSARSRTRSVTGNVAGGSLQLGRRAGRTEGLSGFIGAASTRPTPRAMSTSRASRRWRAGLVGFQQQGSGIFNSQAIRRSDRKPRRLRAELRNDCGVAGGFKVLHRHLGASTLAPAPSGRRRRVGQLSGPLGWAGKSGDNEGVIENTLSTINVIGDGIACLAASPVWGTNGLSVGLDLKGGRGQGTDRQCAVA